MKSPWLVWPLAVLLAAPVVAQSFGKNKVRYDSFTWKEYATPHFRISFYDRVEPSLPKLASFAESAYDDLARRLNFQITSPVPIIAYAAHSEFEQTNTLLESISEGVGAFALPSRNRIVLPVDMPDARLQELIAHELTHIFQFEILYQGKLGKALTNRPPQWFMEGMASYFAHDEDARAKAVMRDAVLSDRIPSVGVGFEGYAAYRFGNIVFTFIEAEWGEEGVRDFIFEVRNTLGGSVAKAIKRSFDLDVEEFDARFRTWLRKRYQPFTADRGDPREFGPVFRVDETVGSHEASPIASPSGDFVAAFSTYKEDVDVVILGVPDRKLYKNLTRGNTTRYEYLVAQLFTVAAEQGRDLAYSPDGRHVAVFGRREDGRVLLLLDAFKGGIDRAIRIPVDQALSPAFSPDGQQIAFHAYGNGQADIYLLDLATGTVTNLTQDEAYDGDPTYTPDGKSIVYTSQTGEYSKIYQIEVADPTRRRQLSFGPGNDEGVTLSRDGTTIYFASDRDAGVLDIYAFNRESLQLTRLTHVFGAACNPVSVTTRDGERVIYQAYSKGRWLLFQTDPTQGVLLGAQEGAKESPAREPFVPAVSVTVDKQKIEPVKKHNLVIDDISVQVGINDDQTLLSQTYLSLSDNYGDRRIDLVLSSVESYTTFFATYAHLAKRLQWGATVFDDRSYYVYATDVSGERIERKETYHETGAVAFAQYPLSLYHRVSGAAGYIHRSIGYPMFTETGGVQFASLTDNIPYLMTSMTGDKVFWQGYGPHAGRRYNFLASYSHDVSNGGPLSWTLQMDARQYVPLTRRNELAFRLFAAYADGNRPDFFYFGGLDTMRGYDYRSLVGNRAAYLNAEWRFPLVDYLILPWLQISDIRGRVFVDVGAVWFDMPAYTVEIGGEEIHVPAYKQDFTFMEDGRLKDGVGAIGFGLSVNLFGLPAHWDFAKRWDFKESLDDGFRTYFWIGRRF